MSQMPESTLAVPSGVSAISRKPAPQACVDLSSEAVERQVTRARQHHMIETTAIWSPDGEWIVYDTPEDLSCISGTDIEQVHVVTGRVETLYRSPQGAACGSVGYHPREARILFIHGPENPTPEWSYGFSRRRGALVDTARPQVSRPLDAMNYAPPFVAGALRGGSHAHVFSGDGQWVSFTYDDEVLEQAAARGLAGDPNQRNLGVSIPAGPVRVNRNHPRNHDGDYFSVVVSRTVTHPRPGSDEICRAFEESWIGRDGYVRADGTRQRRALAFQGLVTAVDGATHAEVFVVDLPSDLTQANGELLEGTLTRRPAPPADVVQRRLTFTDDRVHRGVRGPRHWLRSAPDGSRIAFLLQDDRGVVQIALVSPQGGECRQLTHHAWSVASGFTWSPDGSLLAYIMDNSVWVTDAVTGRSFRLTARTADALAPKSAACVFSPDGRQIAFTRMVAWAEGGEVFHQVCVVGVPEIE